jgi:uncharacterized integral membrane protein
MNIATKDLQRNPVKWQIIFQQQINCILIAILLMGMVINCLRKLSKKVCAVIWPVQFLIIF